LIGSTVYLENETGGCPEETIYKSLSIFAERESQLVEIIIPPSEPIVFGIRTDRIIVGGLDIPFLKTQDDWNSIPDHSKANHVSMDARIYKKRT
jgi:hypothetical protein